MRRRRLQQLLAVARAGHVVSGLGQQGVLEPGPRQRKRLVRAQHVAHDRAVVGDGHVDRVGRRPTLHLDLLAHHLRLAPATLELVHPRVVGVQPLDEQVLGVGHHVREPVRDVLGLGEDGERVRGQGGAAHAVVVADELGLVPEVRRGEGQVRIAREQRLARHRALARHDPVVRPRCVHAEAEHLAHARDLLRQVVPLAGVGVARLHDDRIAAGILRLEPGRAFGPGEPHDPGAQQLHLPVRGQPEAHQLGGGEQVDRVPRLGLEAQELELDRQRAGRVDPGVDPRHVRGREGRQSGATARVPRARRRGACRACASAGPRAGRLPRRTRTAARPWCGGRTRAARDDPARGRSRVRT